MARELRTVLDGYSFFESPRWHEGALWASDFYTHQVIRMAPGEAAEKVVDVPGQPSGLGWLPDGRLLVVSMRDRRLLRLEDGALVEHADLSGLASWHLNDMVVDQSGRAYVGNFGFDLMGGAPASPANLIRVDPDGSATVEAEEMLFPNGTVLAPDGRTLIVGESFAQRLTAFDVAPDGSLSGRRVWAKLGEVPDTDDVPTALAQATLTPDGIALDAEGAIWVADALGGRVVRVREGGEIAEEISGEGLGIFACALGGADGRTLFLCAAPSFAEHERQDTREARMLACEVDVPHAGLP